MRVAIIDSVRTAISRAFHGRLRETRGDDLAAHAIDGLLARQCWLAPNRIDDCVIGCAFPEATQGMNLGRNAAVLSPLGRDVAGLTISRYCASGLDAIALAAARIASDQAELAIAGGVESISTVMKSINAAQLFNPAIAERSPGSYVAMSWHDASVAFWKRAFRSMGETAEIIARRAGISRAAQDAVAARSQVRTARAEATGAFRDEIVPLAVTLANGPGAGERVTVDRDDCLRPDTTREALAALAPSFRIDGSVTAGNAAPPADGAAVALLASEVAVERAGQVPLGWFTGYATVGCDPELMASGAHLAIRKLLARHQLSASDIDLFEINEVFAAQLIHCLQALGLNDERVNPAGGALALGHPFGMTGARLVGHAARELARRGERRAIVAMCVGGGVGVAALIERVPT